MTRGIRYRLMAFVVLSAIGITYVTATYLGLVDRVTGRDLNVTATLPQSGGLFEGSEVTYRGVKIGKISAMATGEDGIELQLTLDHDVELPTDSSMYVHNLSAVGEQYLDFQPRTRSRRTRRTARFQGRRVGAAGRRGRPAGRHRRLRGLGRPARACRWSSRSSASMFGDTGRELQTLLDSGSTFVGEASAAHRRDRAPPAQRADGAPHPERPEGEHPQLRQRPQRRSPRPCAAATRISGRCSRRRRGPRVRWSPAEGPRADAADPAQRPGLRRPDVSSTCRVWSSSWSPTRRMIAGGPTGSTKDGWGHINLQFDYSVPPCTDGYLTAQRSGARRSDPTDAPVYPAECQSRRRTNARPETRPPRAAQRVPSPRLQWQLRPGHRPGAGHPRCQRNPVEFSQPGNLSVLGGDAWKWLLVGPVARR